MTIKEFVEKVSELRKANDRFIIYSSLAKTQGTTKAMNENLKLLFELEHEIDKATPLFQRGLHCGNCKYFDIHHCTNDDMDYTCCIHNGEYEYTSFDGLCPLFEPIELLVN